VAGDAAVGEEVGRVGEDEVDGGFGDLGEEVEAVALVDAEVVFGVVEGGGGKIHRAEVARWDRVGGRFGHDDDRSGSLIRWAMESSAGKKWRVTSGEWRELKKKRINAEGAENTEARRGKERFLDCAGRRFAGAKRKKKSARFARNDNLLNTTAIPSPNGLG
jgi:hypothetical protein